MAGFALKVKTKVGPVVVDNLTSESTIKDLKILLSNISNIPVHNLHVLSGFPPKTLDLSRDNLTLNASGIVSGETLILEEKSNVDRQADRNVGVKYTDTIQTQTNDAQFAQQVSLSQGILMKHVVPPDNSCLFTSIHYVLNGKSTEEYCRWIQDDTSWGGAIELSILANYYGVEIAVADTINAIINRFGEDQNFSHRVFLLFDGIHYDPLYLEPFEVGNNIKTIFPSEDLSLLNGGNVG
ncbi:hiv-induced protein-7-like protease [Holotrichia oblita]|uniref:Hiv-induced protein-7-like protease n=1 Tax=Holotrichia oblita TaxID=644536 RepID=A0ACB9T0V0_HOLOL|nr:hiv-induced protein-7-like protease [Holotrichia oblita]